MTPIFLCHRTISVEALKGTQSTDSPEKLTYWILIFLDAAADFGEPAHRRDHCFPPHNTCLFSVVRVCEQLAWGCNSAMNWSNNVNPDTLITVSPAVATSILTVTSQMNQEFSSCTCYGRGSFEVNWRILWAELPVTQPTVSRTVKETQRSDVILAKSPTGLSFLDPQLVGGVV